MALAKATLPIEAARRKASAFASGVCFVALAPLATADFVLVAIAQSLGLQTTSGDLRAQVSAYLQPRASCCWSWTTSNICRTQQPLWPTCSTSHRV